MREIKLKWQGKEAVVKEDHAFMICDAVPRVVAWKLAKAEGVRVLVLARAKKRRQVHCAAVRSEPTCSLREARPICTSNSAI